MSKKNLILLSILAIIVFVVVSFILYFQSLKTVSFDVKQRDITINVRPGNSSTILQTFNSSTTMKLPAGKYIAAIEGVEFDTSDIPFEVVDKDTSVTINPSYSEGKLREILVEEQAAINKVITEKYADQMENFDLKNGQLYKHGEWYATLLVKKIQSRSDEPDIYRVVLKKEGDKWVIKTTPALSLSAKEYPEIPFEVLSAINQKTPGL